MRQQTLPGHIGFQRIFDRFPGTPFGAAEDAHDPGDQLRRPFRHAATRRGKPRRAQNGGIGINKCFRHRPQYQMSAHAVAQHDMRSRVTGAPIIEQRLQITHPCREIIDMADMRMRPATPRPPLPAPVDGGYVPSARVEIVKCFQIFFIKISPPGHEQDGASRPVLPPVELPEFPVIGSDPGLFCCVFRNRPAIKAPSLQVCHITLGHCHSIGK